MNFELLVFKYLGLTHSGIYKIHTHLTKDEITMLLEGDALSVQFQYNILNEEEVNLLLDFRSVEKVKEKVKSIIIKSRELGIKMISYFDSEYPASLKKISNPPLFLFTKGNHHLLYDENMIACVGTRSPTQGAINTVNEIVTGLSRRGIPIVSGLAYGVDAISHQTCIDNDGETVAVLAHGLDKIYPKEHHSLAEKIIRNGGLLVSEYPLETNINKSNFVQRNRIVSGLSRGVIIFEADKSSGTMHTARFAYKQNKVIFCPEDNNSTGVEQLLSQPWSIGINHFSQIIEQFNHREMVSYTNYKDSISHILSVMNIELSDEAINQYLSETNYKHGISINSNLLKQVGDIASENNIPVNAFLEILILAVVNKLKGDVNQ